ncbi:unnamed protein product [Amoebophrya sp. A120]|nr:unnamed protein product [Amoebophrya sp. A120]|eukprot:GSA120T00009555001.1
MTHKQLHGCSSPHFLIPLYTEILMHPRLQESIKYHNPDDDDDLEAPLRTALHEERDEEVELEHDDDEASAASAPEYVGTAELSVPLYALCIAKARAH